MDAVDDVACQLGALVRGLKGLHAEVTEELGLRLELPAFGLLTTLEEHSGARLSTVAELLRLDLSSISRQVAGLERDGLVARERDPQDSRAWLLHLTGEGAALLTRVRAARAALLHTRLTGWEESELATFASLLARFAADTTRTRAIPTQETR